MITHQQALAALIAYEAQPTRRALLDALHVQPIRLVQGLLILGALRIGYVAGLLFERKLSPLLGLSGGAAEAFFWLNAILTGGFHVFIFLRFYEKTLFRIQRRRVLTAMTAARPDLTIDKGTLKAEGVRWAGLEVGEAQGGDQGSAGTAKLKG
ncbi:hypothetical protein KKF91_02705 [Myxococcota bacterium]|nr:hypothetical protein [Myxococcota bacterium]MBU1429450.1 hypothetical protein [Myxococcota bacterium]MBU1898452.1 hypothetical protein [Myxococcota bacterium]